MVDKTIRNFYDFDDADLEANRSRQLSNKQRQMLASRSNTFKFGGLGIAVFFFVIAALFPLVMVPTGLLILLISGDWHAALECWGASLLWLAVFGGIGAFVMTKGNARANAGYVLKSSTGPVQLTAIHVRSSTGSQGYTEHQMSIGGELFVLDDELVGHIRQDDTCTVYFIDFQNGSEGLILSMDLLSKA